MILTKMVSFIFIYGSLEVTAMEAPDSLKPSCNSSAIINEVLDSPNHKRTYDVIKTLPFLDHEEKTSKRQCLEGKKVPIKMASSLSELPTVALLTIFKKLDYADLKNTGQVSKLFRQLTLESILWKSLAQKNTINFSTRPIEIRSLDFYELAAYPEHLPPARILKIDRENPTCLFFSFDMAYGHCFGKFNDLSCCLLKNFDGVDVFLKTAAGRSLHLKTAASQIMNSDVLYCLIPASTTFKTPQEALRALRPYLLFSYDDFPLQVSFRLRSNRIERKLSGISESLGVIEAEGYGVTIKPASNHFYNADELYFAPSLNLESLFPTDKLAIKTVILANSDLQFGQNGRIFLADEGVDDIYHLQVILTAENDAGVEIRILFNKDAYVGGY